MKSAPSYERTRELDRIALELLKSGAASMQSAYLQAMNLLAKLERANPVEKRGE